MPIVPSINRSVNLFFLPPAKIPDIKSNLFSCGTLLLLSDSDVILFSNIPDQKMQKRQIELKCSKGKEYGLAQLPDLVNVF